MPRVFVPKQVKKRDRTTREIIQAYDYTDAMRFGQLTQILRDSDSEVFLDANYERITEVMADVTVDDYLLLVGDPVTMSLCSIAMAKKLGQINVLKWDSRAKCYYPHQTKV